MPDEFLRPAAVLLLWGRLGRPSRLSLGLIS